MPETSWPRGSPPAPVRLTIRMASRALSYFDPPMSDANGWSLPDGGTRRRSRNGSALQRSHTAMRARTGRHRMAGQCRCRRTCGRTKSRGDPRRGRTPEGFAGRTSRRQSDRTRALTFVTWRCQSSRAFLTATRVRGWQSSGQLRPMRTPSSVGLLWPALEGRARDAARSRHDLLRAARTRRGKRRGLRGTSGSRRPAENSGQPVLEAGIEQR
jgi:hypothetical protein